MHRPQPGDLVRCPDEDGVVSRGSRAPVQCTEHQKLVAVPGPVPQDGRRDHPPRSAPVQLLESRGLVQHQGAGEVVHPQFCERDGVTSAVEHL